MNTATKVYLSLSIGFLLLALYESNREVSTTLVREPEVKLPVAPAPAPIETLADVPPVVTDAK